MSNISYLLTTPRSWFALAAWPKFSVTSYRMVSSLKAQGIAPRAVIDVGANVGQFAVACAKVFGVPVHSFEPEPGALDRLRRNVAGLSRVIVHPVALGAHTGEAAFHVN